MLKCGPRKPLSKDKRKERGKVSMYVYYTVCGHCGDHPSVERSTEIMQIASLFFLVLVVCFSLSFFMSSFIRILHFLIPTIIFPLPFLFLLKKLK